MAKKKNAALSLRERLLNNKVKQAQVEVLGETFIIKQTTQRETQTLLQSITYEAKVPMNDIDFNAFTVISTCRDLDGEFVFAPADYHDILEMSSAFVSAYMVEYDRAFNVTNEEIEGNSTGTESV